jgi:ribonuclease HI
MLVWTDGSRTKEKAGFGVYFLSNSLLNTAERTIGDQTSDNAELQAMLRALKITADMQDIHIITDNESVCILVKCLINHQHR